MASRWQRFTGWVNRNVLRRPPPPTQLPPLEPVPPPVTPPAPPPVAPPVAPPPEPPEEPLGGQWRDDTDLYRTPPEEVPLFGNIQSWDQVITVSFEGIIIGTEYWATWYNDTVHMSAEEFDDKYLISQYPVLLYLSEMFNWSQADWDAWRDEYIATV